MEKNAFSFGSRHRMNRAIAGKDPNIDVVGKSKNMYSSAKTQVKAKGQAVKKRVGDAGRSTKKRVGDAGRSAKDTGGGFLSYFKNKRPKSNKAKLREAVSKSQSVDKLNARKPGQAVSGKKDIKSMFQALKAKREGY